MSSTEADTTGVFHFLTPDTDSSLFRNDRVRMTRDDRGNSVDSEGVATEAHEVAVIDARRLSAANAKLSQKTI